MPFGFGCLLLLFLLYLWIIFIQLGPSFYHSVFKRGCCYLAQLQQPLESHLLCVQVWDQLCTQVHQMIWTLNPNPYVLLELSVEKQTIESPLCQACLWNVLVHHIFFPSISLSLAVHSLWETMCLTDGDRLTSYHLLHFDFLPPDFFVWLGGTWNKNSSKFVDLQKCLFWGYNLFTFLYIYMYTHTHSIF